MALNSVTSSTASYAPPPPPPPKPQAEARKDGDRDDSSVSAAQNTSASTVNTQGQTVGSLVNTTA